MAPLGAKIPKPPMETTKRSNRWVPQRLEMKCCFTPRDPPAHVYGEPKLHEIAIISLQREDMLPTYPLPSPTQRALFQASLGLGRRPVRQDQAPSPTDRRFHSPDQHGGRTPVASPIL